MNVFEKFGGIRPMAAALETPPSTVMSWQAKRSIPAWRRPAIIAKAAELGIPLDPQELTSGALESVEA